jgi:hypothetical protein
MALCVHQSNCTHSGCVESNKAASAQGISLHHTQRIDCLFREHQREWTRHLISISTPFMLKVLRGLFARVFYKIPSRWQLPARVPHMRPGQGGAG